MSPVICRTLKIMALKRTSSPDRKPRADAERNRTRILEAARAAFARSGANASLDEIARKAGVGPGTLYRHFPTREDLLAAVYRNEVEKLAAAQRELSARLPPVEALRAWLLLFVDYIEAKRMIVPALSAPSGGHARVLKTSRDDISSAIEALVRRAIRSGDLRRDTDPLDLLRALFGVANIAPGPHWSRSARRLVDVLIAGSRPR